MALPLIPKNNLTMWIFIAVGIALFAMVGVPFYVLMIIAYPLPELMPVAFGVGFTIIVPFYKVGKTKYGVLFGGATVLSALFISLSGILFTYNQEARTVLAIVIPIIISILIIHAIKK